MQDFMSCILFILKINICSLNSKRKGLPQTIAASLFSGFGEKAFSAFGAGHFDSSLAARQTQTLLTFFTADVPVGAILSPKQPLSKAALDRGPVLHKHTVFLLPLINFLRHHTPDGNDAADK